jgi:hypothetical protein
MEVPKDCNIRMIKVVVVDVGTRMQSKVVFRC